MILTAEQNKIVACNDNLIFVEARAGAAKTTTLVKYAEARPRKKILYIAYNSAIAKEAQTKFPSNVKCSTMHAMAYAKFGVPYNKKNKLGNVRAIDIANAIGKNFGDARTLLAILNKFLSSAEPKISITMVVNEGIPSVAAESIKKQVECIWAKMIDLDDAMPMSHDGYLKLYHLSGEALAGYDIVMLDEKQDTNSVAMDIILKSAGKKIMVGDKYQSIYAFRGASQAVQRAVKPDVTFTLTGSFRFGPTIANAANALLSLSGEQVKTIGLSKEKGVIVSYGATPVALPESGTTAYISRTNSALFLHALDLMDAKIPFAFNSGDEKMNVILDVNHLKLGRTYSIKNTFIKKFDNLGELIDYADDADDKETKTLIAIVKKYSNIEHLIETVRAKASLYTGKERMLSTIHSSKGKEWDTVIIGNDFVNLKKISGKIQNTESQQEINCLYVQLTRAKKSLHLPAELHGFIQKLSQQMPKQEPEVAHSEAGTRQLF